MSGKPLHRALALVLLVVVGLAALEHFSGTRREVVAVVIGRVQDTATENPSDTYRLRLRTASGDRLEVEVPVGLAYREGAAARLEETSGGLFGSRSYRFVAYR